MKNLLQKLKNRAPKTGESARQYTAYQRRAEEAIGLASGGLPGAVYHQMQLDAMVQTSLTVKKLAVLAAPLALKPASDSADAKRNHEFVEAAMLRLQGTIQEALYASMDAFAMGWSVQELVWKEAEGRLWLDAIKPKDPTAFGLSLDPFGTITGLHLQLPGENAVDLPRSKFVIYRNRATYGRPRGASDLDAAYRHYQQKQALLGAWKLHLERFASPTVLGKYERGLPPDEQGAILGALNNLQDSTAIVFPSEVDIALLGGARESAGGFLDAIDFHNREIARSILGQTLTTDEGRRVGSLALGRVHLQVLMLQTAALRRELAESVLTEQIVRPLVEANFGPGDIPRYEFDAAPIEAFVTGKI